MRRKRLLAFILAFSMVFSNAFLVSATSSIDEEDELAASEESGEAEEEAGEEEEAEDTEEQDVGNNFKYGEAYDQDTEDSERTVLTAESNPYTSVLEGYKEKGYKSVAEKTEIVLDVSDAIGENPFRFRDGEMVLDGKTEKVKGIEFFKTNDDANCPYVEWSFDVQEEGLYEIYVDLMPLKSFGTIIQRKIEIDGVIGFDELYNVYFSRHFEEDGEVEKNAIGNEVWPSHVEKEIWKQQAVLDNKGYFTDPLQFYFDKGTHTIKIHYVDQDIVMGNVYLRGSKEYETYAEYQKKHSDKKTANKGATFQAENATWKSESTIRRDSDTDPKTQSADGSLNSATAQLLNSIGGSRWEEGNQIIAWTLEVPEDGLYTINARGSQNSNAGMPSYRQIYIDGEIPFEELKLYPFEYQSGGWSAFTLSEHDEDGNIGDPYQFYLTKGTHELKMVVKSGSMYQVVAKTKEAINQISEVYLDITKVIGTNPDPNVEYNLYKEMPELKGRFNSIADELQKCVDLLADISTLQTEMESNYEALISGMRSFADKPDLVVTGLSDLEDAQTSLGDYILNMGSMPLTFDYFSVLPVDEEFTIEKSNFGIKLWFSVLNFLASFVKNYDAVGSIASEDGGYETLDVWLARGREWGEVLKKMADESFTKENGIGINLNILPSGQLDAGKVSALMLAITSKTAPDVALAVAESDPVEFAFRDAVIDLTQFDDFEEYIEDQFYPTMFTPFKYERDGHVGVYGLPETMDFTVLIYRTDIFDSMEIAVPKSWEDLWNTTLPELYKNNMSFSCPVDAVSNSNSPSALRAMTMYLMQEGGTYYRDTKQEEGKLNPTDSVEGLYSNLDTAEGFQAFQKWTDMYVNYGLDAESSFFTRFRTGSLPIGVGTYNSYMQVLTQAPELFGRWGIAPMLGTEVLNEETGKIEIDNRIAGLTQTACQILSQSKKQKESWEFIKWWMDEKTQTQYGQEIEATMGITARWNTANKPAFNSLPWDEEDIQIITEQMGKAVEQPIVLGGYFTTRHLTYAWNRVYMGGQNPRDSLEEAVKDINKELRTKHEEYGFVYED